MESSMLRVSCKVSEYLIYIESIYNLGNKTVLYLICNRICWSVRENGTASVNTDSQWNEQEACFARANQLWLAVNYNTSVTSGE